MFESPAWQSLRLRRVRYLVPWDYAKHRDQRDEVDHYMARAPRRAPGRPGDLYRTPRVLHRGALLDADGVSRAERERVSQGIPGV